MAEPHLLEIHLYKRYHFLETINVHTILNGNYFNTIRDISIWSKVVDQLTNHWPNRLSTKWRGYVFRCTSRKCPIAGADSVTWRLSSHESMCYNHFIYTVFTFILCSVPVIYCKVYTFYIALQCASLDCNYKELRNTWHITVCCANSCHFAIFLFH